MTMQELDTVAAERERFHPTDDQIAAAWRAWPKTSITSAANAIKFVRSVLGPMPPESAEQAAP
jgi:hypothetical protein